jgi:hypothetical protein
MAIQVCELSEPFDGIQSLLDSAAAALPEEIIQQKSPRFARQTVATDHRIFFFHRAAVSIVHKVAVIRLPSPSSRCPALENDMPAIFIFEEAPSESQISDGFLRDSKPCFFVCRNFADPSDSRPIELSEMTSESKLELQLCLLSCLSMPELSKNSLDVVEVPLSNKESWNAFSSIPHYSSRFRGLRSYVVRASVTTSRATQQTLQTRLENLLLWLSHQNDLVLLNTAHQCRYSSRITYGNPTDPVEWATFLTTFFC